MPTKKAPIYEPEFGSFTPFDPNAPPAIIIPAEEPPLPTPQAVSSVPQTGPGGGVSYEGFLYSLLSSQIDATSGDTRARISDTPNDPSSLRGWHIDKLDANLANSHGISFDVEGETRWEIGVDYDTAATGTADFITAYDPSVLANEVQLVTVGTNTAGQFKLTFSGQQTANIAYNASAATVESALEALSNLDTADVAVEGNAGGPWLVTFAGVYAATNVDLMTLANGDTPLSGGSGQGVSVVYSGGEGADLMRWSSYADGTGVQAPKLQISAPAGTPRAQTEFVLINAPAGLGALSCRFKDNGGTVNAFNLVNQSVTKKRSIINLQNCWQMGVDYQNTGVEHFYLVDSNRTAGAITRLFIAGDGGLTNLAGVNTNSPLSMWHIGTSSDASLQDTIQTALSAGFSTLTNRCLHWQQVVGASQTDNFFWMMGTCGSSTVQGTPTATSIGPTSHALECTNTTLSILSAASGTNSSVNRVVKVGNNTLAFFDGTVASKQTVSGAKGGNAALGSLLTALAAYGLITDSSSA